MAELAKELRRAAQAISSARALIIAAGSGIGVDSGLPDFRGPEGLWRAYPPLKKLGLSLPGMSTPRWFTQDPEFAWGFFGHRYHLYHSTEPHKGFQLLKKWAENMEKGYFIFTSNVDGHFQKAGFDPDKIMECHGSSNYLQCIDQDVSQEIWPVPEDFNVEVDMETLRAEPPLPLGPPGDEVTLARPNILMFGDAEWIETRALMQQAKLDSFEMTIGLQRDMKLVVIEIGAGLTVPTVRCTSERYASWIGDRVTLVRINPSDPSVPKGHISLPMRGLEALQRIDDIINSGE